ncbi:MAG TPA: selenocysteine-specific translation elongation factor [Actinomycetota bacterium]|nr:selenocysteine-specific translation elongation factor [Actinomycetota bacterium]
MPGTLGVIATAGHVDHGKSALIVALTGIDPDRFEEEKRRGLTIDLGYAWTTLPSGREVGFVDVPGHERFIRNMLAGVGPVRLVLFVVAADEGWKPQTEEHLQILDVLGIAGGVIALTKTDLVDADGLALATDDVREHIAGTVLADAPIVPVSARTGDGLPDLIAALDGLVLDAPVPEEARTRLFVDRVFTITGAGTVVTGTLTGGCLRVDEEVALEPGGVRARIRSLQTHKRAKDDACHVARVAVNLAGVERAPLRRGLVLTEPRAFRPTTVVDAIVRPVRDVDRVPERGAFLLHHGAAETSAKIRVLERRSDGALLVRVRTDEPLVVDVGDRFVLWEAGRRRVVGGGIALDPAPPRAATRRHVAFLARRAATDDRQQRAALAIEEAGAIRTTELELQTGAISSSTAPDGWLVSDDLTERIATSVTASLETFHREQPLAQGAPLDVARRTVLDAVRAHRARTEPGIADAMLDRLASESVIVRDATTVRLATHAVQLAEHEPELDALVAAISGDHEATPPTVKQLVASGVDPALIDAAGRSGRVVRLSPDLIVTPEVVAHATQLTREHAADGVTVSALREALGTSRKYAVPLAEYLDATGVTRRVGDLRFPRDDA